MLWSSSGLGRRSLKAATRVQIPFRAHNVVWFHNGHIAQLVRAPGLHPGGRDFDYLCVQHIVIMV